MRLLGFEQESIQQVLTVLAAVLILGDIVSIARVCVCV